MAATSQYVGMEAYLPEVEETLESWNNTTLDDPVAESSLETGEWVKYTVEEDNGGYSHYVEFDIPNRVKQADREEITGGVHSDLVQQGFVFGSVDFMANRCRVLRGRWFEDRKPRADR